MDKEQAKKEFMAMLDEAKDGTGRPAEEVFAELEEKFSAKNVFYITGDTHGEFERIKNFCQQHEVEPENTFIILGDVGLNYFGGGTDRKGKKKLSKIPVTFFCIHGNHELRPSKALGYEIQEYRGGKVWVEPAYPNILFAIDGEIYDFMGYSCLVIGGAYSVDKYYRLARGYRWFPDEQPSEEIKRKVESVLAARDWKVDVVFAHTCPLRYEPVEVFLPMIDQSTVDKSTEIWLEKIEQKLTYERWYCGHYHLAKKIDKIQFMFEDYDILPHTLNLQEEAELIRRMERQAEIVQALGLLDDIEGET